MAIPNTARWTAALACALAAAACDLPLLTPAAETAPAPVAAPPHTRGRVTDHVIVISVDGLRPDAIERFGARTLRRLIREGSHTLDARTIVPSITLPAHTSMLTGTEPAVHGVDWNGEEVARRGYVGTPTIFTAAKQAGYRTAAFFSKAKFLHLAAPGTLDYALLPRGSERWSAERTVQLAQLYMADKRPNLLFVHLGEPDFIGHRWEWMSIAYGVAVRQADAAIADLLYAADRVYGINGYTVIVTADHGGAGHRHGGAGAADVTIPWIAWGRGVARGRALPAGVRTMDTAASALWLLGVQPPEGSVGRALTAAFEPAQPARS